MTETKRAKKGMPRGMYIGSAWIGFAIFMLLCWVISLSAANSYIEQGLGSARNFQIILTLIPVFGFALPMIVGVRTLRRAGRHAREAAQRERERPGKEA